MNSVVAGHHATAAARAAVAGAGRRRARHTRRPARPLVSSHSRACRRRTRRGALARAWAGRARTQRRYGIAQEGILAAPVGAGQDLVSADLDAVDVRVIGRRAVRSAVADLDDPWPLQCARPSASKPASPGAARRRRSTRCARTRSRRGEAGVQHDTTCRALDVEGALRARGPPGAAPTRACRAAGTAAAGTAVAAMISDVAARTARRRDIAIGLLVRHEGRVGV
jgi:hypothetical protein